MWYRYIDIWCVFFLLLQQSSLKNSSRNCGTWGRKWGIGSSSLRKPILEQSSFKYIQGSYMWLCPGFLDLILRAALIVRVLSWKSSHIMTSLMQAFPSFFEIFRDMVTFTICTEQIKLSFLLLTCIFILAWYFSDFRLYNLHRPICSVRLMNLDLRIPACVIYIYLGILTSSVPGCHWISGCQDFWLYYLDTPENPEVQCSWGNTGSLDYRISGLTWEPRIPFFLLDPAKSTVVLCLNTA